MLENHFVGWLYRQWLFLLSDDGALIECCPRRLLKNSKIIVVHYNRRIRIFKIVSLPSDLDIGRILKCESRFWFNEQFDHLLARVSVAYVCSSSNRKYIFWAIFECNIGIIQYRTHASSQRARWGSYRYCLCNCTIEGRISDAFTTILRGNWSLSLDEYLICCLQASHLKW